MQFFRQHKRFRVLIACVICVCSVVWQAGAISAQSAILMDADTGTVLYALDADTERLMASTTKIMTALVAIESLASLDMVYTVQSAYMTEGSSMGLAVGDRLTVRDTLYGLMLNSGNDAALAIAGVCGGYTSTGTLTAEEAIANFVEMMNQTALDLGLYHTHFDNPSGLDGDTHYTTARELAKLTAYALQNETFATIVSTVNYTGVSSNGVLYDMTNHNKMLWLYEGAIGVKTGYTIASGRCLVSAATQDDRTLIVVTLSDPDDWVDHASLFDLGFAQYQSTTLHKVGDTLATLSVQGGEADTVEVVANQALTLSLTTDEQTALTVTVETPDFVYAPVTAGQSIGQVIYSVDGVELASQSLYIAQNIAQADPTPDLTLWEKLVQFILKLFGV